MPVQSLFHAAVKTADLERSRRFYCGVLGLSVVPRPPLDFPGLWLAAPGFERQPLIHLYAGDAAREPDGGFASGTGALDHLSILARDFAGFRDTFREHGLSWRENVLREAGLWQLFVYDPSGLLVELTFRANEEVISEPVVADGLQYRPAEIFFASHQYS